MTLGVAFPALLFTDRRGQKEDPGFSSRQSVLFAWHLLPWDCLQGEHWGDEKQEACSQPAGAPWGQWRRTQPVSRDFRSPTLLSKPQARPCRPGLTFFLYLTNVL